MSMESDKDRASSEVARTQSQLSRQLANQSYPALSRALSEIFGDLNAAKAGGGSIADSYKTALADMNKQYDQTGMVNAELLKQQARQSGMSFGEGQISSTIGQQQYGIDQSRRIAMGKLQYQEGAANMQNYTNLLSMLGQGTNASVGISQGFLQNQLGAAGMMSGTSPGQGAMAGAASGASLGTSIYPGWGTLIGGVVGAGAGYFGAGG